MGRRGKSLGLILLLLFSTSLVAMPHITAALAPYVILSATTITETTVTLSWTNSVFTANSFTSYTLYMSTASNYNSGHPFTPIWSTSDRQQITTIVNNLSRSSKYYLYILDSGFGGQAESSNLLEVQTLPNPASTPSPTTNNSAPTIAWQQEYGDYDTEAVSNLIQTTDGGYAFLDLGWSHGFTLAPSTLYKTDSLGNLQWQKGLGSFTAINFIQTSDEGFEISGNWNTYPLSKTTPALIKTDSAGNIQWVQNYTSEPPNLSIPSSTIHADNGVISLGSGNITKVDSNGTLQWQLSAAFTFLGFKTPTVQLTSLIETSDGSIAALGVGTPYGHPMWEGNIYLVKTETFLPQPSPSALSTPIPTPIAVGDLTFTLSIPIIVVIIALVFILLLYRRHRKTPYPSRNSS